MFYIFMAGVCLFLLGFYSGRVWVTRLEGKTVSLKTVCIAIFVVMVGAVGIISLSTRMNHNSQANLNTEPAAETVTIIK